MRVHLIHGFNVSDGGARSLGHLKEALTAAGHVPVMHDYGWTGPLRLRLRNRRTVAQLLEKIEPGDAVIGHSNGALIARKLALGAPDRIRAVVCIQPCVRRDIAWSPAIRVLCLYNPYDWIVNVGRVWGRMATLATPWAPHGWGAAGRYGFTTPQPNVEQWDTSNPHWGIPARGHSEALRVPAIYYWRSKISLWLSAVEAEAGARDNDPVMQAAG